MWGDHALMNFEQNIRDNEIICDYSNQFPDAFLSRLPLWLEIIVITCVLAAFYFFLRLQETDRQLKLSCT